MQLINLWLQNFRNHENLVIDFDEKLTVVMGANGSGKTNILEAVYLLATGKSFRAEKTEEMVYWQAPVGRVKARIENPVELEIKTAEEEEKEINFADPIELEVTLTRGMLQDKRVASKLFSVNGVRRLQHNFVGQLRAVLFGPWDMRLIEGSPTRRREFLNDLLCQVSPEYRRALVSYEKGLRSRNKVLQAINEGIASRSQLFFWDRLLIKEGNILTDQRRRLIEFLNEESGKNSEVRSQESEERETTFQIVYDPSTISEQRLAQYEREEVAATVTLVGPHRDDFNIKLETRNSKFETMEQFNNETIDLSIYGSRGQQRMAILWLKLGELAFIKQETKDQPVLLLDDIFSELDHGHREVVMKMIEDYQTVITAADEHLVEQNKGKVVRLINQ